MGNQIKQQNLYGYIRVSSRDQHEERQMFAMNAYQIPKKNLFIEKISGKDFERPQYKKMIRKLKKGDLLVIKSIDRLGRNYEAILEQWRVLTKELGVQIVVLDMPLLSNRDSGDLTGMLIADIVLQLLSYIAEKERENIRERQAEGIAAAKKRGVHCGRPRKNLKKDLEQVGKKWKNGELTSLEAGALLGISRQTFMRRMKSMEEKESVRI